MKPNYPMVALVMLIFAMISLVTNILDPLMPNIKESFQLTGFTAGLMAFAFFIAYGIMSIPAGVLVQHFGPKRVILAGFGLALVGSLLFATGASYAAALPSLFTIAIGFTLLQVVANPLLRAAGGREHYAFFGTLSQLAFGAASFLGPYVYSYLVLQLGSPGDVPNFLIRLLSRLVPPALPWVSVYWLFAALALLMVALVSLLRVPALRVSEEESVGSLHTLLRLLRQRVVWLFFLGIFCYVGTEQGVAIWLSQFLKSYHGIDPAQGGHAAVARFWGSMMVGCLAGLLLVKLFDARRILSAFGLGAAATLVVGLFGSREMALLALPSLGFWFAIMWPLIFSLALNSLHSHHGPFAGILCTGLMGGAFTPPIVGKLGDLFGLRYGLLALLVTLGYIIAIGFWARPLVHNAVLGGDKARSS